ncbi:response regulator transcription factor [Sphingobacterium spiritivorum]|uniref:Transcriptional regulator, LuxR family n=1 Tax=Sphingobacterium spiritivorum ATCC 33861 TaxID=525373 RepID=D7VK06_SPHSI|nr:response regulator transcription factor [Sphingobacterium spiritivorum]EFK58608.1 transcriptional regulator, LuxR family [Sphingobacterium spiritivorum ATCC 33861]QQT34486.1 response regulator transcription factor [Sphingobacterium spiritivorum]WQD35345.1 response regulator transcription factor [Sphingobacterium spiritivorum]SUJ00172.1 Virulence factors putative positive transcription regulator BvgA [Sphingobacterium spiritivorum]
MSTRNILIADSHPVARLGVSTLLEQFLTDIDIYIASNFEELQSMLLVVKYDLLIMEIELPNGNWVAIVDQILSVQKDLKIIILSKQDNKFLASASFMKKTFAYVCKDQSIEYIRNVIQTVLSGSKHFRKEKTSQQFILKEPNNETQTISIILSPREMEVSFLLLKGSSIKDIAKVLNLSKTAVSTYKIRLFKKLGVKNIAELYNLLNHKQLPSFNI